VHGEKKTFDLLYEENINDYTKVVFIGDYWDSFHISFEEQVECFLEIIALKKKYPEKIVLLLGNHDIHYLTNKTEYSGYQHDKWREIQKLMQENLDLFQSAYQYKDVLFTHAGLSQTFFEYLLKPLEFNKWYKNINAKIKY